MYAFHAADPRGDEMEQDEPIAFLSYVRADDEHEHGRITELRERLEGEVRMHTGEAFTIFQDKRDLKWGQKWNARLENTLLSVTFLIPVITPSYFKSETCKKEFSQFRLREKQLGEDRLILPVYYLNADEMVDPNPSEIDDIATVLASRNWADWRTLRFKDLRSMEVAHSISEMARTIKGAMKELEGVITASKFVPPRPPTIPLEKVDLRDFSPVVPLFKPELITTGGEKEVKIPPYFIYTRSYDEEILASELSDTEQLKKLSTDLQRKKKPISVTFKDVIVNAEKTLKKLKQDSVSVTLLIDNSGSMRGNKIEHTASWALILSELFEVCGIPVEVLGYTTRAWKGGQSRERWLADGKPLHPGRLNDVRHIIYKPFTESTRNSAANFSLMIREGLLKENIDGEAVLWAYNRAAELKRKRSIIIVFSDGAPVDDSTLSVNRADFLEQHLIATIQWLSKRPGVELHGVGIEHKCSRYYASSVYANSSSTVGAEVLQMLPTWISSNR